MKKYLIFIDIDDTLLVRGGAKIPEETVKELERVKSLGNVLVVSSGRCMHRIESVEGVSVFDYYSGMFGNVVRSSKNEEDGFTSNVMDSKDVKRFVDYITEKGKIWTYKDSYDEKTVCKEMLFKFNVLYVDKQTYLDDLNSNSVFQILVNGNIDKDDYKLFPEFDFYYMPGDYLDVVRKGSSKAKVIEKLKQRYPDCITVAIGDSANDVDMLEYAEISIAMDNANDEVKKCAKYVTKSVEENGVIYALQNILKI